MFLCVLSIACFVERDLCFRFMNKKVAGKGVRVVKIDVHDRRKLEISCSVSSSFFHILSFFLLILSIFIICISPLLSLPIDIHNSTVAVLSLLLPSLSERTTPPAPNETEKRQKERRRN